MANNKDIQRVASEIAALSKSSQTAAGRPDPEPVNPQLIDAINQVFALFQVNYHNQYYSAFGDTTKSENLAKNLWCKKLNSFSPTVICGAAERVIAESDYLPTLHKMLNACRAQSLPVGLSNARTAYLEACRKPGPKIDQKWSHPIVYLAGRDTGWHLLANEIESKALPAFSDVFQRYCNRLVDGEKFVIDKIETETLLEERPSSKDFSQKEIKKLRDLLS
jgi:hypothetical protein